jgi:hypothetical protein
MNPGPRETARAAVVHAIPESVTMTSQPVLNTTPLFQTSLRDWQAQWKEHQSQAEAPGSEPHRTRPGRYARRSRRPIARPQA